MISRPGKTFGKQFYGGKRGYLGGALACSFRVGGENICDGWKYLAGNFRAGREDIWAGRRDLAGNWRREAADMFWLAVPGRGARKQGQAKVFDSMS